MDKLFEHAVANVFMRILVLSLDGCYECHGLVGRSVPFIEKIARIWGLPGGERKEGLRGRRREGVFETECCTCTRELIVLRDPLWDKVLLGRQD